MRAHVQVTNAHAAACTAFCEMGALQCGLMCGHLPTTSSLSAQGG